MARSKPEPMPDAEVARRLLGHPAWRREDGCIVRRLEFTTFMNGIEFINRVASQAEEIDHHPDILISWRRVTLTLYSHDAGGITARDFALAGRIDALVSESTGKVTS
ncbi:MAG TPA: 4a-hydroxytetrahydrobiopterin dehydratase [Candidatus Polarisedimenticolia bacterium]|jgi:4a-hydroxytetrahydrobiopterin dehydratase